MMDNYIGLIYYHNGMFKWTIFKGYYFVLVCEDHYEEKCVKMPQKVAIKVMKILT